MTEETKKTEPTKKIKRERSSAYPAISLESAVELSKKLIDAYGKSPFSRDLAVKGMGYETISGASAPKVAALKHYGLLERQGVDTYKNSTLAESILHFTSDEERRNAILEAITKPKLFNSLIEEYSGRAVPSLLKNILVTKYKIGRNVTDSVVKTFKESIEYAGIYANDIITFDVDSDEGIEQEEKKGGESSNIGSEGVKVTGSPKINSGKNEDMQNVTLPSGIIIHYPNELAYSFAVGEFSEQIKALENAVTAFIEQNKDEEDSTEKQENTPTSE